MNLKDKAAFKRAQQAGLLGNYFRMWDTVADVRAAEYTGWLTVRARQASDRALFIPTVQASRLWDYDRYLMINNPPAIGGYDVHARLDAVYLQECPHPDAGRIINLEASVGLNGWKAQAGDAELYVKYALNDPTNLRHSLEQNGRVVRGLQAWAVLRHYLDGDLTQLLDIWDQFPDATIEASRFSQRCGVFHSQTITWEAREF